MLRTRGWRYAAASILLAAGVILPASAAGAADVTADFLRAQRVHSHYMSPELAATPPSATVPVG
jgi:hypothetical protein